MKNARGTERLCSGRAQVCIEESNVISQPPIETDKVNGGEVS
jgi:hypothetical protein